MTVASAKRWLAVVGAAAFVVAGILGGALGVADNTADNVIWVVLLVAGGALILLGLVAMQRWSAWLGAALITVGAVAGSLIVIWTVVAPIGALVLIALSWIDARRAAGGTARRPRVA